MVYISEWWEMRWRPVEALIATRVSKLERNSGCMRSMVEREEGNPRL